MVSNTMFRKSVAMALVGLGFSFPSAFAAPKKSVEKLPPSRFSNELFPISLQNPERLQDEALNYFLKNDGNVKRTVSSDSIKPDVAEFVKAFTSVTTADQIDQLFERYATGDKSQNQSLDLKYFLTQLKPLKAMRGIVWRMRPIVETGGPLSGSKATHSAIVSLLRSVSIDIGTYAPDQQWRALFEYMTVPTKQMSVDDQFMKMSDFQNFMAGPVYASLTEAVVSTQKIIYACKNSGTPLRFVWDNQLAFGKGTFEDGVRRYVTISAPEVMATLASVELAQHSILAFNAFNTDSLPKVMSEIGREHGIDGFIPGKDLGVTSEDINNIVRKYAKSEGYLSLRKGDGKHPSGQEMLKIAFKHLDNASVYVKNAYDFLQQNGNANPSVIFNPILYRTDINPLLKQGASNMRDAVTKEDTFRSPVTGEKVQLSVARFYNNIPADFSLAQFLPSKFEKGTASERTLVSEKTNETLHYRDYRIGSPIQWNNDKWSILVPSCKGGSDDCIQKAARTVRFTPGLEFMTPFFSGFVN